MLSLQQQQQHHLQQHQHHHDHDDQAAMEVDNLCNKLVDDLNSPQTAEAAMFFPTDELSPLSANMDILSKTATDLSDVRVVERSPPARRDGRVNTRDRQKVMEEEEVQNVVNQGRELLLMSPDASPQP